MAKTRMDSWTEIVKPAWQLLQLDRRELGYVFAYIIALGLISAVVPFSSQIVVNQTAFTGTALPVVVLAIIVFGVLIIGVFVRIFQLRVVELLKKRVFARVGFQAAQSLINSSSRNSPSDDREIANRFFEVVNFQNNFAYLISDALAVFALAFFGIILLALYHPFLLAFSVLVVAGCVFVIAPLARRGVKTNYEKSTEKYRVAYWLSEVAENRALLRQGAEDHLIWRITDRFISKYTIAHLRYLNLMIIQSGGLFLVQAIGSSAFLGLGGWLVVKGQLNLGQLVSAEIIILSVLSSLSKFDKYLDATYDTIVSAQKIKQLTELETSSEAHELHSHPLGESISSISINSSLLANKASFNAGDIIRVEGDNKTRRFDFLNSLAGGTQTEITEFILTTSTQEKLNEAFRHRNVLFISHPYVFRLSLEENLKLLFDEQSTVSSIHEKFEHQVYATFQNLKPSTMMIPEGLSWSERARISALRAFFSSRPIVILDQFFDFIETEQQLVYIKLFKEHFPNRILVINSSDPKIKSVFTATISIGGGAR